MLASNNLIKKTLLLIFIFSNLSSNAQNCNQIDYNIFKTDNINPILLNYISILDTTKYVNKAYTDISLTCNCKKNLIKKIKSPKYGLGIHLFLTFQLNKKNLQLNYNYNYNTNNEVISISFEINNLKWTQYNSGDIFINRKELRKISLMWRDFMTLKDCK